MIDFSSTQLESGSLADLPELLRGLGASRWVVVCDSNLERCLDWSWAGPRLVVPAGEVSKCLARAENLYGQLAELEVDRKTWLVAVGGGLVHMVGWGFYLADPWKRALWICMAVFWLGLLSYVRVFKPLFQLRRPYRVSEVRPERGDTVTLVMHPEGHTGWRFTPGQFGWLTLWGSPFKITAHPFSFSSSAEAPDGRVEMSIRNLGDFTQGMAQVPVGQRVYLDGPYGAFTIGNPADLHVLVAGGIGITP